MRLHSLKHMSAYLLCILARRVYSIHTTNADKIDDLQMFSHGAIRTIAYCIWRCRQLQIGL